MGCLFRPCLPRFLERCLRAESARMLQSGQGTQARMKWGTLTARRESKEGSKKEGGQPRAGESLTRPVSGSNFPWTVTKNRSQRKSLAVTTFFKNFQPASPDYQNHKKAQLRS